MQMLCLRNSDTRLALWARRWGWMLGLTWQLCAAASPAPSGLASSPAAPTSSFEVLQQQALQWAATYPAFQGKSLHVAPLDSRITVQTCQQTLQFDQPFPNQASVRVRCAQPMWQLFITLNQGSEAAVVTRNGPAAPVLHKVLVSKELLKRGTVITPAMFTSAEMPAAGMENQLMVDSKLLVNMELVRDLTPNTPLRTYDLKNAVLIKRGQEVQVTAGQGQGFVITMRAESLQDGGLGEQIRLKNSESGRSLTGIVTGPNAARLR